MSRNSIYLFDFGITLLVLLGLVLGGGIALCPGSFGNAVFYKYHVSESKLKSVINEIKKENPKFAVPDKFVPDWEHPYWSQHYIYIPELERVFYLVTRPKVYFVDEVPINSKTQSTIGYVGLNFWVNGESHWESACMLCGLIEKDSVVEPFEERILKLINQKIKSP